MSLDEVSSFLKKREQQRIEEWEKIRKLCFYSSQSGISEKEFSIKYFPLPWDKKREKKVSKLTREEAHDKAKKMEKWLDKKMYR